MSNNFDRDTDGVHRGNGPSDLRFDAQARDGHVSVSVRKADDSALPRLNRFDYMAQAVATYRARHGGWPRIAATADAESDLGIWVGEQIDARMHGKLPDACKTKLDAVIPGWLFALQDIRSPAVE